MTGVLATARNLLKENKKGMERKGERGKERGKGKGKGKGKAFATASY